MIPEPIAAFGLATLGVSLLPGLYYSTYVGFAIMAGSSPDRYGARFPIFDGVLTVAAGSVHVGARFDRHGGEQRLVQRTGSAFAFTGARELSGGRPDLGRCHRSISHSDVLLARDRCGCTTGARHAGRQFVIAGDRDRT